MKIRTIFIAFTLLACGIATPTQLGAQQTGNAVRVSAVLSADTVVVGEPFTIGVVAESSEPVLMPPLLPSGEGWEQLEVARVETTDSEVRAYYRLVAWQTDRIELPNLNVLSGPDGGREISVSLPGPMIRSILPTGAENPLLQSPRPPIDQGFPWPLLLVALILLAMILWWMKHRATTSPIVEATAEQENDAASRAREAVLALRSEAEIGTVAAAGFYDELELILRHYLSGTRAWPSGHPVRESRALAGSSMRDLHRQAVLARFAAVGWPGPRLVADADASLDWLTEDNQ